MFTQSLLAFVQKQPEKLHASKKPESSGHLSKTDAKKVSNRKLMLSFLAHCFTCITYSNLIMRTRLLWQQSVVSTNPLDSSAPVKRGKERENPKPKKPSALKKVILKEREAKKQLRLNDEPASAIDGNVDSMLALSGNVESSGEGKFLTHFNAIRTVYTIYACVCIMVGCEHWLKKRWCWYK